MSKLKLPARYQNYDVGYGKPPKENQFKKGKSGNPNGRPRGSKNKPKSVTDDRLKAMILEEVYREIPINDETGTMTMPIVQAGLRSMTVKAAKGDYRSLKLMTELVDQAEAEKARQRQFGIAEAMEYLVQADREVQRRERNGQSVADIIPHPEDMFIDADAGTVTVIGPMTYIDRKRMIKLIELREDFVALIDEDERRLKRTRDPNKRAVIEKHLKALEKSIKRIDDHLQGWRPKD